MISQRRADRARRHGRNEGRSTAWSGRAVPRDSIPTTTTRSGPIPGGSTQSTQSYFNSEMPKAPAPCPSPCSHCLLPYVPLKTRSSSPSSAAEAALHPAARHSCRVSSRRQVAGSGQATSQLHRVCSTKGNRLSTFSLSICAGLRMFVNVSTRTRAAGSRMHAWERILIELQVSGSRACVRAWEGNVGSQVLRWCDLAV